MKKAKPAAKKAATRPKPKAKAAAPAVKAKAPRKAKPAPAPEPALAPVAAEATKPVPPKAKTSPKPVAREIKPKTGPTTDPVVGAGPMPAVEIVPGKARKGDGKRKRASMRKGTAQQLAAQQMEQGDRGEADQEEHGNSRYRPEYIKQMLDYFDAQAHEEETNLKTGMSERVFANWPTFQGFAKILGVTTDTLNLWATEMDSKGARLRRPEFAAAYARAREMQQHTLQQGGMSGAYAQPFAVLAAKNILGWKDKVETDGTLQITEVDPAALDAIYTQKQVESAALNATRGR